MWELWTPKFDANSCLKNAKCNVHPTLHAHALNAWICCVKVELANSRSRYKRNQNDSIEDDRMRSVDCEYVLDKESI